MPANFNNSAWFYDRLARIVYGRALIKAQIYLLQFIPAESKILIIGGGTGWILEEIAELYPAGLKITYVDIALGMINRAKKRSAGGNKITFINDAIENITLPADFDVIITPFLLDNFTEQNLSKIFGHVHPLLKLNGMWLNSSFQLSGKWWQPVLLKTMFLFFRLICLIEAQELPAIEQRFEQHGYQVLAQQTFYNGFIISRFYLR